MLNKGINSMEYNFEVAGIYYDNKDGTSRKDIIKKHLDIDDYTKINVSLIRHGGNKHDRNAIGVYISKSGFFGFNNLMIGFVPREDAKEISPMLKEGGEIISAEIYKVWLPSWSDKARPHVHITINTNCTENDVEEMYKRIKDERRKKRLEKRSMSSATDKNNVILKKVINYILNIAILISVYFLIFK